MGQRINISLVVAQRGEKWVEHVEAISESGSDTDRSTCASRLRKSHTLI